MYWKRKSLVWTDQQDRLLTQITQCKQKKWTLISEELLKLYDINKTAKQCRERWYNHLDPCISKRLWTSEQQNIVFEEHQKYGSRWKKIAQKLPGRSDNSIKNYFYCTVRKILRRINKFIGQKNCTKTIKQIKSTIISQIFHMEQSQMGEKKQNSDKIAQDNSIKCRLIAYQLINESRRRLMENKQQLTKEEIQNFCYLIKEMIKISKEKIKKKDSDIDICQKVGGQGGARLKKGSMDELYIEQSQSDEQKSRQENRYLKNFDLKQQAKVFQQNKSIGNQNIQISCKSNITPNIKTQKQYIKDKQHLVKCQVHCNTNNNNANHYNVPQFYNNNNQGQTIIQQNNVQCKQHQINHNEELNHSTTTIKCKLHCQSQSQQKKELLKEQQNRKSHIKCQFTDEQNVGIVVNKKMINLMKEQIKKQLFNQFNALFQNYVLVDRSYLMAFPESSFYVISFSFGFCNQINTANSQ